MTWYECKLIALQKMFSVEGREIVEDTSTREYLAGMPHAANEAMRMLATVGRGIIRDIEILQNPPKNLLVGAPQPGEDGGLHLSAQGGRSWVFEAAGPAVCTVLVDGEAVDEVDVADTGRYQLYRGQVDNTGGVLELAFASDYPYMVRNAGVYRERYPAAERVPQASGWIRYELAGLVDDFYMLKADDLVYEGKRYHKGNFFRFEGDDVLVLARDKAGMYKVYYYAYPPDFGDETPSETVMPLSPEENALVPLYMASELYKDDDLAIATTYRNEFEVGLERLRSSDKEQGREVFESGWI